jgi:hypothetical protein
MSIKHLLSSVERGTPAYDELTRLISKCDSLGVVRDGLATQLAKMKHTQDGVLVVLGKTIIWRTRYDGMDLHGVVVGMDVVDKTFHARWYENMDFRYEQTVAMSRCYGSEAALLKGESNA